MSKYKVILKALYVKLNPESRLSGTTGLTVTGLLDPDQMTTPMVNLVDLEATWTVDNVIAKASRNLDQKAEVLVKIEMENGKPITTLTLDILPYVTQVEPGSRRRFEIKQSVTDKRNKTIVIGLSLAISRDIDRKTPKTTPRNDLRLKSKMYSEKSVLNSPRSKLLNSESFISPRKLEIETKGLRHSVKTEPNSPLMNSESFISPRKLEIETKDLRYSVKTEPNSSLMNSESFISPRKLEIETKGLRHSVRTEPNSPKDGTTTVHPNETKKNLSKSFEELSDVSTTLNASVDQEQPIGNILEKRETHSAKRLRANSLLCRTVAKRNIPRLIHQDKEKSSEEVSSNNEDVVIVQPPSQSSSGSFFKTPTSSPSTTPDPSPRQISSPMSLAPPPGSPTSMMEKSIPTAVSSPGGQSINTSATLPRLVERAKVPTTSKTYQPRSVIRKSRTQPKKKLLTFGDSMESQNDISLLKEEYKCRAAEAAVEDLIKAPVPSDRHVVAIIIWRCLIKWDAFILDDGLHLRIATLCERAVKDYAGSLNMLSHWLATSLSLLYMTEEELKKSHREEEENRLMEYHQYMQSVSSVAFESILTLLQSRLGPVMQVVMDEVLSSTSPAMGDDMPPRLADLLEQVRSYIECMQQRWVLEEVKLQFLFRVIHFFCTFILDNLIHHSSTYAQGLQIKQMIPKLEEWAIDILGPHVVHQVRAELEPMRQIANVLCLPQKTDLVTTSFRTAVCPLLRPMHVANLLASYRPDQFLSETVPDTVIQEVLDQDTYDEKQAVPGLFNPQFGKVLDFSFKGEVLDLEDVAIPKVVLDHQAFAFLKPQINDSGNGLGW